MSRRGSYERSDYAWSSVLREAAHYLMDEGAGDRPLSVGEIAAAVKARAAVPAGDYLRAAERVEGHRDTDRGAEILTTEALKILKRGRLVTEGGDGWRWVGNGRTHFQAHGRKFALPPREERERQRARALVEAQFITPEHQLPKREFDPTTADNRALIASLKAVGFDDDFPILVDEEGEIVDGYQRAAACELLGIDWRNHTRRISLAHTGPTRNMERTGKQVRANIGTGLSLATRRALAAKLKIEGHTGADLAEALGVSITTANRDARSGSLTTVVSEPAAPRLSDDDLVRLCMEEIQARPDRSKNSTLNALNAAGHRFAKARALKAYDVALSRLTMGAPPPTEEPKPDEPKHECVCPTCGTAHNPTGGTT